MNMLKSFTHFSALAILTTMTSFISTNSLAQSTPIKSRLTNEVWTQAYLTSDEFKTDESKVLLNSFEPGTHQNFDGLLKTITSYSQSEAISELTALYSFRLWELFKIEGDVTDYLAQHSDIFSAISNYVEDPADDSEPFWSRANTFLRTGKSLDELTQSDLKKFILDLDQSFYDLPFYQGLVFRGAVMNQRRADDITSALQNKTVYEDKAYFSTSLLPEIAFKFSQFMDNTNNNNWRVLYVINVTRGIPVSFVSPDHNGEKEILLARNSKFIIKNILTDSKNKRKIVFMNQQ